MQSKANIYDLETANNEIGQIIHDAKRRLLDAHRKGVSLSSATETFFAEVGNVIHRANVRLHGEPADEDPQPATATADKLRDARDAVITAAGKINELVTDARVEESEETERDREFEARQTALREIEALAKKAVFPGQADQQLAVISILATISKGDDPEAIANAAMYAAFKCCDSLHDDAIRRIVEAGKEDHADAKKADERHARRLAEGGDA